MMTFRPRSSHGSVKYASYKQSEDALRHGFTLRQAVKLPKDKTLDDWIALHIVDFLSQINLIYGTVSDSCTEISCPTMSGGRKYEYHWCDKDQYKKPTKLSAPKYIELLMKWVKAQINDEEVFPVSVGVPFPKNYQAVCKKILSRLFRVFVHVYIHHYEAIVTGGAEKHMNTCYKHFYYFVTEFDLVNKNELEPLREITEKVVLKVVRDPM